MAKDLNTDLTLVNCLFGAVKLTKNVDPDKCKYSGYGIGFDLSALLCILIVEINIFKFLVKDQHKA